MLCEVCSDIGFVRAAENGVFYIIANWETNEVTIIRVSLSQIQVLRTRAHSLPKSVACPQIINLSVRLSQSLPAVRWLSLEALNLLHLAVLPSNVFPIFTIDNPFGSLYPELPLRE